MPDVKEFGPFVYREYDEWTEPTVWDEPATVPGSNNKKNSIKMVYNTYSEYDQGETAKEVDSTLDTPIWQINQAGQGVWYGATHTPDWRIYLNVI